MALIDLSSLALQVEQLISNPSVAPVSTGDATLDASIVDFSTARAEGTVNLADANFWY